MKTKCDTCPALELQSDRCQLGCKIKPVWNKHGIKGCKPLEDCPKPKTYKAYFDLKVKGWKSKHGK